MKQFFTLTISIILLLILSSSTAYTQKPKVWIYTDMSDKTLPGNNSQGTINDPDDMSAMAAYLLMCNEYHTLGIVVTSTHRSQHATTPNQGDWANTFYGDAYRAEVASLNHHIGGYPEDIFFQQSCIKESAEHFSNDKDYKDISGYSTVKALLDTALTMDDTINVLIWGSTTEPAILVKHCLNTGKEDVLKKLRFIAHWTNSTLHQGTVSEPWKVANCNEDLKACNYLKARALAREIDYYENGAIGQHGIVSGSYTGTTYFNQFKVSKLGKIFAESKYAYSKVDHSDAATYWTLLGTHGVSLDDINPNGTNPTSTEQANENKYKSWSKRIHDELLRRAKLAATPVTSFRHIPENQPVVYPNPAATILTLELEEGSHGSYSIYDTSGRLYMRGKVDRRKVSLDLSGLPEGMYVLAIDRSPETFRQKLIISR